MEYTVVSVVEIDFLVNRVNDFIKRGWKPLGGVSVTKQGRGELLVYHQAMVKEG